MQFADVIRPALKQTKVWVTGGFRTASSMVEAIQHGSTDGIGLARPVTEEPQLPKLLISGKVSAARKPLLDENDFGITNVAAGTQIRQIGNSVQPFNSSDEKEVAHFKEEMGTWMAGIGESVAKGVVPVGYITLSGSAYEAA